MNETTDEIVCANCAYFHDTGEAMGQCRRYPPVQNDHALLFPKVYFDNWCGEWHYKEGAQS